MQHGGDAEQRGGGEGGGGSLASRVAEGAAADGSDACAIDTARGAALRMIIRALHPLVETSASAEPGAPMMLRKLNLQGNGIDDSSCAVLRSLFGAAVRLDYRTKHKE